MPTLALLLLTFGFTMGVELNLSFPLCHSQFSSDERCCMSFARILNHNVNVDELILSLLNIVD